MDLERAVGRIVMAGTYASVALLALGVAAMAAAGRSPLDEPFPPLDLARLPGDLASGRVEGFLWLGLIAAIATPAMRVAAALVGYVARRELAMAAISVTILGVIVFSVVLATGLGG